ncbi:MAG: PilZ domain-containing protein [Chloroflexi bacterium]|nr:PilZ domain-containing protein [Chloroflexota bacterium]
MAITESWEEQRRAPRTSVDVEAELRLGGQVYHGVIQDLSFCGSLFIPEQRLQVAQGERGRFRFALPTALSWIEPHIEVRRVTNFPMVGRRDGQAVAFEFSGLTLEHERAIAAGCLEWSSHRQREYSLAASCSVQGLGANADFKRLGRAVSGSRDLVRISLPAEADLPRGAMVQLRVSNTSVEASVQSTEQERQGSVVQARLTGWGRDFFLHEARRGILASSGLGGHFSL